MRVLVIGGGAREHALCWAVSRSPLLTALYCAPGNGGTAQLATNVPLNPMEFAACAEWAAGHAIDLTIIGPDDPLGGGIVDIFAAHGLKVFGPTAAAARIESSKAWAKQLLLDNGIPTAQATRFTDYAAAEAALRERETKGAFPVVIKADGLAAGKGVVIAHDAETARQALEDIMVRQTLGAAGNSVLLEEYLEGPELSLFALTDGATVYPLAPACDYKRALDGDEGPNTGGMGAYSPPGFATRDLLAEIESRILRPTMRALATAGAPFRGLLYAGLMLTSAGPQVIEFNARFGDPETQVVLPRLDGDEGDLLALLLATAEGRLAAMPAPTWSSSVTCGVVAASAGYPGPFEKGKPITGLDTLDADVLVFHAGTQRTGDGQLVTAGGRVLTVVARGNDMASARAHAYANIARIHFDGMRWRNDIAAREVVGHSD
jgi:phosphoribosylamine--glycine ligase